MRSIILFIGILFSAINGVGQSVRGVALSVKPAKEIDSLFKPADNLHSPGYAIGIIKGKDILYKKGYGAANLDYSIAISDTTSFQIASVSKQFTAACIALLILDNKLSLETPAGKFIPELNKYADTIRIKHLIYNTSGIIDYFNLPRPCGLSWISFDYFDIDECIRTSLTPDTLAFKPGEQWSYCNTNYMLLAKIVEKISGKAFSEFSRTRIFSPLCMSQTLIDDDITAIIPNRATPYFVRDEETVKAYRRNGIAVKEEGKYMQHPRTSPHYGGSGVQTTVNDLLKWGINYNTKILGGEMLYNLMHTRLIFNHPMQNQAFGLYFSRYHGRITLSWEGSDAGISAELIHFPEQQVVIVVLSNLGSGQADKKARLIADVLIKGGYL